jgi:hypothetical protein
MHAIGLKTDDKKETAPSARKGTVISMAPSTTIPTDNIPQMEDTMKGGRGKGFLA